MSGERGGGATILHADLDAFYASVEQRDDPDLRGRPVLVGGGVVLACSYEAKRAGVRTAMNGRQARAICPEAVVVPPRMEAYSAASRDVFAIFRDTTPLVEGLSVDEAFLEVGGLARLVGDAEGDRGPAARAGARRGRAADHGGRGADEVPREGRERRSPSPTACSSSTPTGSGSSCTRCAWSGSGASAR